MVTSLASTLTSMLLGLWFIPYLISRLGPAAYGLIPLATTIVNYFSLLSQSAGTSVSRHLSVALHASDEAAPARLFQSAKKAFLILTAALVVPIAAVSIAAPQIVHVPAGTENAARFLFAAVGVTLLLTVYSTPHRSVLFTRKLLYIDANANILHTIIRTALAVLLFSLFGASLVYVAVGLIVGAALSTLMRIAAVRRFEPQLRAGRHPIDRNVIREIGVTASGLMFGQLAAIVLLSSDLLLVNLWFGAHLAGYYAAVLQLALIVRLTGLNLGTIFTPTILDFGAKGVTDTMVASAQSAMRALGLLVTLPVAIIAGCGGTLLALWLGESFRSYGTILGIMLLGMPLTICVQPLFAVTLACDKTRTPGFVAVATGLAHIALSYLLSVVAGLGPIGVAISAVTVLVFKNVIFTPAYAARLIDRPVSVFLQPMLGQSLVLIVVFAVTRLLIWSFAPTKLFQLVLLCAPAGALAALLAFLALSNEQRTRLRRSLHGMQAFAGRSLGALRGAG